MNNEQFVKTKYPDATIEKYQTHGFKAKTYYLVWESHIRCDRKQLGEGATKAQAWKDAKEWLDDKDIPLENIEI